MRILLTFLLGVASCGLANAQTSAPSKAVGWARVQAQPVGTKLQVKAMKESATCMLQSVSGDALICTKDGKDVTFPTAEIQRIRVPHRGRSALVGLGIGFGGGAAVGAPFGQSGSFVGHGAAALIFGVPLGAIGAGVGAATDFTRSTIYSTK